MKRHRTLPMDFDYRANVLAIEIQDSWEDGVKNLHHQNREALLRSLAAQFGASEFEQKLVDFRALGPKPVSIMAFHNRFLEQSRRTFVIGAYYPALVSACALGERILNHVLMAVRDDFRGTPGYKRVYSKSSIDNWDLAIDVLESWQVLLPSVAVKCRSLAERRRRAIHFDPSTDTNDRALSLEALHLLTSIIGEQFGLFGSQPWFIPQARGESFIRKDAEHLPFVRRVFLPHCPLVGPHHRIEGSPDGWRVVDDQDCENREISDEEFLRLRYGG